MSSLTKTSPKPSSDPQKFTAQDLENDLRNNFKFIKGKLQENQSEIHYFEDSRTGTLRNLENSHKEMKKKDINDQVHEVESNRIK